MIFNSADFIFIPPLPVSRAQRILIKPFAPYPLSHPMTTSRETLITIIDGIRRVSDADILILEGTPAGGSVYPIYQALGYNFPRVLMLDVKDCIWVEVENPLVHPFAISSFWIPNVVLSSDYLISVAPFRVYGQNGSFTIENLLGLLPVAKYRGEAPAGLGVLHSLGIQKVIADLYFTVPFDLGIIDGRKKFYSPGDPTQGAIEDFRKILVGEPWEIDAEASRMAGVETEYVKLIETGRMQLEL